MPFTLISRFNFRALGRYLPSVPRENRGALAVCILIAFLFWIIITLTTKDHKIDKPVRINFVVSEDEVLLEPAGAQATAVVVGPGWELMWSNLFQPVIEVSLYRNRSNNRLISEADLVPLVSRALYSDEMSLERLVFQPIKLNTAAKARKRVPVRSRLRFEYAEGFAPSAELVFRPDSVEVWGGQPVLDSLTHWPTDTLTLDEITGDLETVVPLATPPPGLSILTSEVAITQQVEVFTEKELYVPVEVVNPPARDSFSIFPRQVRLRVGVLQSNYDRIDRSDFRLVADLHGMRTEDGRNNIPLQLLRRPPEALSISFTPRKAEYLFFRRE